MTIPEKRQLIWRFFLGRAAAPLSMPTGSAWRPAPAGAGRP
ncbi:hypothetical protein APY03_0787 [Variovorax sp. WDL1]|nr:hypothetical protein APY03_0787 [Variovorax sp. WDL1]